MALAVGLISLLPTPVWPQYLCLCMPFLLVSAVCAASDLLAGLESKRARLIAAAACVSLLGIYVASSVNDFRRFLFTGDGIPGVEVALDKGDWRAQRVMEVSQAIDQIASPGEEVASFWPGDIFQTHTNPFPGFENDFATPLADKLSLQQRARYHMHQPKLKPILPLVGHESLCCVTKSFRLLSGTTLKGCGWRNFSDARFSPTDILYQCCPAKIS